MGILSRIPGAITYAIRGKLPKKKRMPLVPKSKVQVPMPEVQEPLKYGTWHKRAILASSKTTVDEYVKAVMLSDKEIEMMSMAIGLIVDGNTKFYNNIANQAYKLKYDKKSKPSIYIIYYLLLRPEKTRYSNAALLDTLLHDGDFVDEYFPEARQIYLKDLRAWTGKEYAIEFNRIMNIQKLR